MRSKKGETEKERFFHYTLYLIFRLISVYTVYTEKEQSQGRADCIVETDDYIFEFKRDGTADEALAQIEAKGYARPYEADPRTLYKIGVLFRNGNGGGMENRLIYDLTIYGLLFVNFANSPCRGVSHTP